MNPNYYKITTIMVAALKLILDIKPTSNYHKTPYSAVTSILTISFATNQLLSLATYQKLATTG